MNILYLDHYAGSIHHGRSFRPYYLGQEWLNDEHKLCVVAGSFSHLRYAQPDKLGFEEIDNITYFWVWTPRYQGNGVMRFVSICVFMMQLFINVPRILRHAKPDVIIGSTVYMLDMLPGWIMKKISGAKLVFELHDLWPASLIQIGKMPKYHPFVLLIASAQWLAYKLTDQVISILPNTYPHMEKFGIRKDQFYYVPNGVYEPDWNQQEDLSSDLESKLTTIKKKYDFIVGYAGAHGAANELRNLCLAAQKLQDRNIAFVLIGDGDSKQDLMTLCKTEAIQNIYFFPKISKRQVPKVLSHMDVLYLGVPNKDLYRYGISPNKLFDYMMAQKPVIKTIMEENDIVENSGCGICCASSHPDALKDVILDLYAKTPSQREEMGKKGKAYILKNYTYEILATKFINFIKE